MQKGHPTPILLSRIFYCNQSMKERSTPMLDKERHRSSIDSSAETFPAVYHLFDSIVFGLNRKKESSLLVFDKRLGTVLIGSLCSRERLTLSNLFCCLYQVTAWVDSMCSCCIDMILPINRNSSKLYGINIQMNVRRKKHFNCV